MAKKEISKKLKDDFFLGTETLKGIFDDFQQKSGLFRLTGCFHGAALSDREKILVFAEDIGRHNAVDKVIGYSILENISFAKKSNACKLSPLFRDCLKMCTVEYSHISKQGCPYRSCSRNSRDNRDDPCRFCKGR